MCGIAGKFNFRSGEPVNRDLLEGMAARIAHRGPDDHGLFIDADAGVGLAHRRLSIIDLSTGHQPMADEKENVWIVFNGEIYNFPELKEVLLRKGCRFRTTSDTEVIIQLYLEEGAKGIARLNGIFALALFDRRTRSLLLARDHFGVKPLYYAQVDGQLIFASEIKAILQDTSVRRELDIEALNSFLTFRYSPSPQTLFKNIRKLRPGHYLHAAHGKDPVEGSYWTSRPSTNLAVDEQDAIAEYQRLLEQAVMRQMISDVPVGLLLSGGMDSAILGVLMQRVTQTPIKTFTVGFEGSGDHNELEDARATAKHIGSEHFDLVIGRQEYLEAFLRSFQYTEEPIAETTIPALYRVAGLASSHLKVVLAGQGADEPLAGYHRYLGERFLSRFGGLLTLFPLQRLSRLLPRNERLKRAAHATGFTDEMQRFLAIYTIFTPQQQAALLRPQFQLQDSHAEVEILQKLHVNTSSLHDSLSRMLYIDTRLSLADDLLLFGDKMTMAHSLEMRVPYLDVKLVQFLETLPSTLKLRGVQGKYLHKKAAAKWLPPDIIHRRKRGFATPMDAWLQSDLAPYVGRLFNAQDSACREYFNLEYVNMMIRQHEKGRENYLRHIVALMSFELWHQHFFQNKPVEYGEQLLV